MPAPGTKSLAPGQAEFVVDHVHGFPNGGRRNAGSEPRRDLWVAQAACRQHEDVALVRRQRRALHGSLKGTPRQQRAWPAEYRSGGPAQQLAAGCTATAAAGAMATGAGVLPPSKAAAMSKA
jgi:hypothetical protein